MIIYPLPPEELDDDTLSQQIEAVAQVLCNVHHLKLDDDMKYREKYGLSRVSVRSEQRRIPLAAKGLADPDAFTNWASESRANYKNLWGMGWEACNEWHLRFQEKCTANMQSWEEQYDCGAHHKMKAVIEWARDNVPDLPVNTTCQCFEKECPHEQPTPFPCLVSGKYIVVSNAPENPRLHIEESYRNYYRAKLQKDAKFTRREKPERL